MAYLTIKSSNPELSWVLVKNPESGLYQSEVRRGEMLGWFPSPTSYKLFFTDAEPHNPSFKTEASLNVGEVLSEVPHLDFLGRPLRSALMGASDKDVPAEQTLTFGLLHLTPRQVKFLEKTFKDWECQGKVLQYGNVEITLHHPAATLKSILEIYALICVFSYSRNNQEDSLAHDQLIKYFKLLTIEDFSFCYVFKNLIRTRREFQKLIPYLPQSIQGQPISYAFGPTQTQRFDLVYDFVHDRKKEIPMVDLGSNEGYTYANFLLRAKEIPETIFVERDLSCIQKLERRIANEGASASVVSQDIAKFKYEDPCDCLLIEVIEHVPREEAKEMLINLRDNVNFYKLLITTPNKDFNKFYGMEDSEMRHETHVHEYSPREFEELLREVFETSGEGFIRVCGGFHGDGVGTTFTGLHAIVTKKEWGV